jgi:hypothetical protein
MSTASSCYHNHKKGLFQLNSIPIGNKTSYKKLSYWNFFPFGMFDSAHSNGRKTHSSTHDNARAALDPASRAAWLKKKSFRLEALFVNHLSETAAGGGTPPAASAGAQGLAVPM